MEDRKIGQGNPFSRALGSGRGVQPDDEKATSPGMYIVVGLLSLVLVALFVAALVLPPLFTYSLLVRGIRTGRIGMTIAGGLMGIMYFAVFVALGKRLMGRQQPR